MKKLVSLSQRLKLSLSMNCLNSSVSSFSIAVISHQRFIVLDARVLFVRVLLGVLIGLVGGDSVRDGLGDQLVHSVGVGRWNVAELVVEHFESRSSSGSGLWPPPDVGTGSISASESGSWILTAAFFSTR